MPIDTRKAKRRALRFESVADLLAELDRLGASGRAGTLRHSGNYSPGQVCHHLARWLQRYVDRDVPRDVPLPVRLFGRAMKSRILRRGFPAGLKGPEGKAQPEPDVGFEDALARLREGSAALEGMDLSQPHPMFGFMSHEDCVRAHLRHCELHLGFLHP